MNFRDILEAVFEAFLVQSASFRVGNYSVAISTAMGNPIHLTFGESLVLAEHLVAGIEGSIQLGSVVVSITPSTQATVSPAAKDLAAAMLPLTGAPVSQVTPDTITAAAMAAGRASQSIQARAGATSA